MTTTKTSTIQEIRKAHRLLACIDNNWHVFTLIAHHPGITVTEMFIKLRADQSDVSARVAALRFFDLVSGERDGKNIYYHITERAIHIAHKINNFVNQ